MRLNRILIQTNDDMSLVTGKSILVLASVFDLRMCYISGAIK